jgi:hypothetical protein
VCVGTGDCWPLSLSLSFSGHSLFLSPNRPDCRHTLPILIRMLLPPQSVSMSIRMPNHMSIRLGGGRERERERGRKGEGCEAAGQG